MMRRWIWINMMDLLVIHACMHACVRVSVWTKMAYRCHPENYIWLLKHMEIASFIQFYLSFDKDIDIDNALGMRKAEKCLYIWLHRRDKFFFLFFFFKMLLVYYIYMMLEGRS